MRSGLSYLTSVFWNGNERRLRAPWRLLGAALFVVVITITLGILFAGLGANGAPNMGHLQANVATVAAIWLAARFLDRRAFSDTGVAITRNWCIDLGFGLALGALLMAAIFLVESTAGWVTITETFRTTEDTPSFMIAILLTAFFYLTVGVAEELAFRGYVMLNLAEGFNLNVIGSRWALIGSWIFVSGLFGIAHAIRPNATFVGCANIALAGVFLGLGYVLTGSLAIPIGTHITWNFFQGSVFGFPVSGTTFFPATFAAIEQSGPEAWTGGAFGPEGGLLGTLAILLGILAVAVYVRFRYRKLTLFTDIARYGRRGER